MNPACNFIYLQDKEMDKNSNPFLNSNIKIYNINQKS